jgi:hypothetical protein
MQAEKLLHLLELQSNEMGPDVVIQMRELKDFALCVVD